MPTPSNMPNQRPGHRTRQNVIGIFIKAVLILSIMLLPVLSFAESAQTMGISMTDKPEIVQYDAIYDQACRMLVKEAFLGERDLQVAVEKFQRVLKYYEERGDYRRVQEIFNNLAVAYFRAGFASQALEYLKKASEVIEDVSSRSNVDPRQERFVNLVNLGEAYITLGQYNLAIEFLTRARKLAHATPAGVIAPVAISYALIYLGIAHSELGLYRQALECYQEAQGLTDRPGPLLVLMGQIHIRNGDAGAALGSCLKGVEEWQKGSSDSPWSWPNDPKFNIDWARDLTAHLYLDLGDMENAENVLANSGILSSRGRIYLIRQDYLAAQRFYLELLKWATQGEVADALFTAYTGLGMAYEGQEDYKKAEAYYEKGMKFTEELRSMVPPAERKEFFQVKINGFYRSEPAKGLTRVRMKLNQAAESIDSSEQTRARAFSDAIAQRSQQGVSGVPENILNKEDELVTRLAVLKKQRGKEEKYKNPEKYDNISKEVDKVQSELNKFIAMVRAKYPSYAAIKYPQPVTLKQSAVRPEEYVVMFDVSSEGVGVKLIKGKEIVETAYKRWKLDDLEKDIRRFREPFEQVAVEKTAALKKFDPELGESLYKNLLVRVLVDIPKGTPLVIIPDGVLAVLPFEALVVGGKANWGDGAKGPYPDGLTYLGDVYPISYYQSINSLTLVRSVKGREKTGKRVLVIADPVFHMRDERAQGPKETRLAGEQSKPFSDLMTSIEGASEGKFKFSRLAKTKALGEGLQKLYGNDLELCADLKANKEHFLNTIGPRLPQYGCIVFATHGVFSTKIPGIREPFLALTMVPPGTDGFLTMRDVMSLKMNADVVALTACQTGLGKELSGEGVMSMGRAFQCAGARSVLMSLWSVAEDSSVVLTESFFRNMKDGKSKLEALKLARQEIRQAGYEHPFYWAPFILVGEVQ